MTFNDFWNHLQQQLNYTFDSICSSLSTPTIPIQSPAPSHSLTSTHQIKTIFSEVDDLIDPVYYSDHNNHDFHVEEKIQSPNIQIKEITPSSLLLWIITGVMFGFITGYFFSTRQRRGIFHVISFLM
jgi:hypothetical protein